MLLSDKAQAVDYANKQLLRREWCAMVLSVKEQAVGYAA